MTAELLRRAAAQMRNNNASFEHKRTEDQATLLLVADWLDEQAARRISYGHPMFDGTPVIISGPDPRAVEVARAYLGES